MLNTKDRLSNATGNVKPYVDRAMHDKELRESLQNAWDAARHVYDDLLAPRSRTAIALRAATDKEIQDNLRRAVDELRHAGDRLQGKQSHTARNVALILAGVALGVLFNPKTGGDTRRWLRNRLFGGGGDFDYSSPNASGNGSPGQTV
jgi:hypothetical protein